MTGLTTADAGRKVWLERSKPGSASTQQVVDALRLLALGLAVAVTLTVTPQLGYGNEAYTVGKVLVLGALALVAIATLFPLKALRVPLAGWLFAAYWGHGLLSATASSQPASMSSLALLPELCAGLVMVATAVGTRHDAARRALVFDVIVVSATLMSLIALAESLGVTLPWGGARRPHSTLGNRNFVGAEAAMAAAVACGRYMTRPTLLRLASLAVLVTTVGVSRCRSAWLGALVALTVVGVAVALERRRAPSELSSTVYRAPLWAGAVVIAALAAAALLPWPGLRWTDSANPMRDTLGRITDYKNGTGRERIADLGLAASMAAEHPLFGVGPRGWDDAASARAHEVMGRHATPQHFWSTPNSDVARILGERGVVGLGLLLAAVGALVHGARERSTSRRPGEKLTLLAALVILGVNAALDAPLFRPSSLVLTALLLGLSGGWWDAKIIRLSTVGWRAALIALVVTIVTGTGLRVAAASIVARDPDDTGGMRRAQALLWRSDVAEVLALKLARGGNCSEAEVVGADAMSVSPHHWGVAHALAGCWHAHGNAERAASFARQRDAIEPHVEHLFGAGADVPSGYEKMR